MKERNPLDRRLPYPGRCFASNYSGRSARLRRASLRSGSWHPARGGARGLRTGAGFMAISSIRTAPDSPDERIGAQWTTGESALGAAHLPDTSVSPLGGEVAKTSGTGNRCAERRPYSAKDLIASA